MVDPRETVAAGFKQLRKALVELEENRKSKPPEIRKIVLDTSAALVAFEAQATKEAEGARKFAELGVAAKTLSGLADKAMPVISEELEGLDAAFDSCEVIARSWEGLKTRSGDLRTSMSSLTDADLAQISGLLTQLGSALDRIIEELENRPKS